MIVTATNVTVSGRQDEPDGRRGETSGPRSCRACHAAPLINQTVAQQLRRQGRVPRFRVHRARGLCCDCYEYLRKRKALESFPRERAEPEPSPRTTWAQDALIAEVRTLRRVHGLTLSAAAARLGMREESIARAFQRAGLPGGRDCGR